MAHYIKVELDKIFRVTNPCASNNNFINEIIWHYRRWTGKSASFQKLHDTILWYSKDNLEYKKKFTPIMTDYTEGSKSRKLGGKLTRYSKSNQNQKPYFVSDKEISKDGVRMGDVWTDIPFVAPSAKERLGYPTQKPIALLQRIIKATTVEEDVVSDFFCGCGTAIDAAQSLNRQWIGFDASQTACDVMQQRMEKRHSLFVGINKKPTTYEEFKAMNPFDFEKSIVRHIGGVTSNAQVADGGVDGRLAFDGTPIQVKKESKPIGDIDRFRSFYVHLKSHGRGIFISQEGYTKPAKERASSWRNEGLDIQLLSLKDVVNGNYKEQPMDKAA